MSALPDNASTQPPANWYPDPARPGQLRWWDGSTWTDHVHVDNRPTPGNDPAMRALLPIGRSGWAIASGYLGLFSMLLVFGPFAIITGILGIREIRRKDDVHGMGRCIFGIAMGALGTAGLIAVLLSR